MAPFNTTRQPGAWDYYKWCAGYPTTPVVWSIISMLCFLVGFPANVWVLHELLKRQRQRSNSEIFVLSLAVVDLIFTALIPLCVCNYVLWRNTELQNVFFFMYSLSLNGRPLFMACICWDCYVAVVYPIVYKTSTNLVAVRKAIAINIFFIIVLGTLLVCTNVLRTTTPLMVFSVIVALPVICFCDISILRTLRKPDPSGNNNIHPQKRQALYTILNSFIITFVVYFPPVIIFLFGHLMKLGDIDLKCGLTIYGISFFTVGCVIMPVLYLIRIGKMDNFKNCWKRNDT